MEQANWIEVNTETLGRDVIEIKSMTSDRTYKVDTVNGRCSCPAWKFSRNGARTCKHLEALGIKSFQGGTLISTPKGL